MNIVIIHTDFRIYWPARLQALHSFLSQHKLRLDIIEIAGLGSPYSFAKHEDLQELNWHILFPKEKMEDLNGRSIQHGLFSLLNRLQPDVLICGAIAFPSGALSVSWACLHHKKVICFDDAKVESVQRNSFINFIKQQIYNGIDAMIYPSRDWEKTGLFWNFGKNDLFYGLDVVDNSFWQNFSSSKSPIEEKKYFLGVGRQIPEKNFLYLLQSYQQYLQHCQDEAYPLVLVGNGPEHEQIQDFVNKHNLNNQVTLLPFQTQEQLKAIYHQAEVFVLASKKETWGLVINEAMACGLPIIASDQCGATSTLIQNGVNGFSFSLNQSDSLKETLLRYHHLSPDQKQNMKNKAIETISQWGISRFCQSCYEAIQYVSQQPPKQLSWFNQLIIQCWKGRYRPI